MSDVAWQNGRFRVERTGDPDGPYRYMYSPPEGIPFRLGVKDPEMETLIKVLRDDPQKEAAQSILDDLRRRGLG